MQTMKLYSSYWTCLQPELVQISFFNECIFSQNMVLCWSQHFFLERYCFHLCFFMGMFLNIKILSSLEKKRKKGQETFTHPWECNCFDAVLCFEITWNTLVLQIPAQCKNLPRYLRNCHEVNVCALTVVQLCSTWLSLWGQGQTPLKVAHKPP